MHIKLFSIKVVAIEEEYALMNVMMMWVYILRLTNFLKPIYPNLSLTSLCNIFSSMQQLVQQKLCQYLLLLLVGERGLEPPCLATPVPKTGVSAIPPLAQQI